MKNKTTLAAFFVLFATSAFAQGYGNYGNDRRNNDRQDPPRTNRTYNQRTDVARLPANDRREAARINDLQRETRTRIADGIAQGTLTSREAIRLLNEFENINNKERRYLANHDLTNRETRELTRDLENLIKGIRYENRDAQRENDRYTVRRY
ncbi:hypothetical protein [Persicitalea jodogahamensis]|uniref:Uncharacterized protein n=1 Tax=Persicitalea jodogahamensis TaxID=402147 RepID=A0A8J3D6M5_9BACT|nr:hypothetical protein [Persicitalea jodogahamensis]GHB60833.1 hypothetical protein GCM10007390_13200 [Persicitalea jodogahamensis]